MPGKDCSYPTSTAHLWTFLCSVALLRPSESKHWAGLRDFQIHQHWCPDITRKQGMTTKSGHSSLSIPCSLMSTRPGQRQMGAQESRLLWAVKWPITLIISCVPEPWQGRAAASAGKQLLTEYWPLHLLGFLQDQFVSEVFFLGVRPSSVFSTVSFPSATEKIQFWLDPSSFSFLPKILRKL